VKNTTRRKRIATNSRTICISIPRPRSFYADKYFIRDTIDESRLFDAFSGESRQTGRVREDRHLGPALSQYHDDGERIGLSTRQISQRSLRGGKALLRLGHRQQRDHQPIAERHILL